MVDENRTTTTAAPSRRHFAVIIALVLSILLGRSHAFVPTTTLKSNPASGSELYLFRGLEVQEKERMNGETNGEGLNGNAANGYINGGGSSNIPFIIERLGERPRDEVFKGIAEMCISVFFNNGKQGRAMPPWKEVQLSYLRMIQMADLRRRRGRDKKTNAMYVAYRVEGASPNTALTKPLILNMRDVNNLDSLTGTETNDFVRGEILGFCEVSMVPFGLAPVTAPPLPNGYVFDDAGGDNLNSKRLVPKRMRNADVPRPVLTNLSVKKEARSSGVGSKLLEACERTASGEWGKAEIVLEVENDNVAARLWYQKRRYRVLFSDPTSRRYDVSGLFLKKVGCTRQILRKALHFRTAPVVSKDVKASFDLNNVFRRFRDNVLQTSN